MPYIGGKCEDNSDANTTQLSTTSFPTTSYSQVIKDTASNNSQNVQNGSFVLIFNLSINEFFHRKGEIIKDFEKRFGILMLIKKEPQTSKELIYPYHPK